MNLDEMYKQAAREARAAGCTCDDTPNGCVAQWVRANVTYRPETEFFIVLGIAAELADLEAQAAGFENAIARALDKLAT
jgi:hypothetical protein